MSETIDLTSWQIMDERKPAFTGEYHFGQLSELCDVTDGRRVERARFREADSMLVEMDGGEEEIWHSTGWVDEDGIDELGWTPTHWRPTDRQADC